jgi:hypothetical protein
VIILSFFSDLEKGVFLTQFYNFVTGGGGSEIRLFKNNIVFDNTTTLGSLVEADYATYGGQGIMWGTVVSDGSHGFILDAGSYVFAPGVLGTPQDCYGWYLQDPAGNLIGGDNFAGGPLNMGGTTPAVTINPAVHVP